MKEAFRKIILFSFAILLVGCAATQDTKRPVIARELALKKLADHYGLSYSWDPISQAVFLNRAGASANALVGSDIVLLDDQKIVLSAPLKVERGMVIVPRDFKEKVIDELIVSVDTDRTVPSLRRLRTIIIDAGHGGKDPGAISKSGLYEKVVVLDVAKRLRKILERKGIDVIMTREGDQFISLKDRTVLASKIKADLFVSIHANAHARRSINGIEVYSLKDLSVFEKNEAQRQENHEILFRHLEMKRGDNDLKEILADMLYTFKQSESVLLARDTSQKTAHFLKAKNLGQKSSRFYVLRNTLIPAVLVEIGYLSNPKEERLLKSKAYRQKVAYALARSILDYANKK